MNGFQLTFYTLSNRYHHGKPVAEWLLELADHLAIRGATAFSATEGFGHHHKIHCAHFFELADQPVAVMMVVTELEVQKIFKRLEQEVIRLFYVKLPVEFGTVGGDQPD